MRLGKKTLWQINSIMFLASVHIFSNKVAQKILVLAGLADQLRLNIICVFLRVDGRVCFSFNS